VRLQFIMSDQTVKPGDALVTSGGDEIFPKGLPIGTVARVTPGRNMYLDIAVRPAADLDRLEEVLVITRQAARTDASGPEPVRAADILAEHLPSVPASYTADAAAAGNGTADKPAAQAGTKAPKAGTEEKAAAAKKAAAANQAAKVEKPGAPAAAATAPKAAAQKTPAPARRKAALPGERQPTPQSAAGEGTHAR
jgi:rod shape-determining protein MreC